MTDQSNFIAVPASGETHHVMILAPTRRGKSTLLQLEAARLGISYEELLKRLEPSAEEKERARVREEEAELREGARLDALRQVLWDTKDDDLEGILNDVLSVSGVREKPMPKHCKALFWLLPKHLIGLGVAWDFSDTEVREDIYQFVQENRASVEARLAEVDAA